MDSLIHDFCNEQKELLKLELQSVPSNADERSHVLHQLTVKDISVGLYGRTVVQLQLNNHHHHLAHRFTTGDEVEIRAQRGASGVISQVTDETISVALFETNQKKKKKNDDDDDDDDEFVGPITILPKSSIEVHKKLLAALEELETHGSNHPVAGSVIQTVFESSSSPVAAATESSSSSSIHASFQHDSSTLDDSQKEAVQMALHHQKVTLIHGPPGSGKTTTVVELIRQAVQHHKYRVLVTAPSHVAVDNILSRLDKQQLRVVRLGHPARLQADILPYSLEALVQAAEGTEIVRDVRKELQTWLRLVNNNKKTSDKATARREIKLLRKEIKQREQKVVTELLQRAQVVLATCVGAANLNKTEQLFDLVIIDEAAQSLEAACWIPILRGTKLVLAGDHCQLPPTIQCNDPRVQQGLGHTMFARIMKLYENDTKQISRMLKVQYRMHETIADWASEALYHGELKTHESAQGRTLATLPGVSTEDEDLAHMPLLLIDTAGCDCHESTNAAGSRFNEGEAHIVQQHVQKLLDMGVPASQIAVITPYNGQVEILKSMGMPVEIRTVDGFQGGEREAVVLSLVRSSPQKGSIGFLRDDRRLNVAVTRAKRHCCVVADSETVSLSPFVKNLIEWIEQHGEHRSALDYIMDETHVQISDDLLQAQLELENYLRNGYAKSKKDDAKKKETNAKPLKKKNDNETSAAAREALLVSVRKFHETGKGGDELVLSSELSKGDRHAVHELAEELGILHVSSGTDGIDRRMTLSIPLPDASPKDDLNSADIAHDDDQHIDDPDDPDDHHHHPVEPPKLAAFHILQEDEEESSSVSEDEKPVMAIPPENHTLALLAKEREQREKDRRKEQPTSASTANKKSESKSKKKGQKVGKSSARPTPKDDKTNEIEDDMAFLDAQIDKVQNSHGRTITGKGSNYRTIINGILLKTPTPVAKKKDPRATSALQAKLKQAENSRKAKPKKK